MREKPLPPTDQGKMINGEITYIALQYPLIGSHQQMLKQIGSECVQAMHRADETKEEADIKAYEVLQKTLYAYESGLRRDYGFKVSRKAYNTRLIPKLV